MLNVFSVNNIEPMRNIVNAKVDPKLRNIAECIAPIIRAAL